MIMKNETTMTASALTGDALIAKVNELREANATNSEIAHACGYTRDNGKPAFTEFYTALIEAKGLNEPTEDPEMSELEAELRERHGDSAVDAFCDYWVGADLEHFEDVYLGEWGSGAKFIEDYVDGCYGAPQNQPYWVVIDWEATWENLRGDDFIELDGYIFSLNW
jgi:hypothetical protein